MKWGEIWARRKRSSAWSARRRDRSSSASSRWVETNFATSPVRRRCPAEAAGPSEARAPTTIAVDLDGDDHAGLERAADRIPALELAAPQRLRPAAGEGRLQRALEQRAVRRIEPLRRQDPSEVGHGDGPGAEEGLEVGHGPAALSLVRPARRAGAARLAVWRAS